MSDDPSSHFEVIIVGAGPTGLIAANLFGQAGITTLLIERDQQPSDIPRAIAIDDEGLRICQAIGLREPIIAHMCLDVEAHYRSGTYQLAHVAPTMQYNSYPLIATFHQPTFEQILRTGLERFPCVEMRPGHTLETFTQDEQRVHVTVRAPDQQTLYFNAAYLLACDGARSLIRHQLAIEMQGVTAISLLTKKGNSKQQRPNRALQRWLVVDGIQKNEEKHANEKEITSIFFFCEPSRPAVTVPSPGGRRRWEFMLLPGDREEELLQEESIHRLIKQLNQSSIQILRSSIYTFHALLAERFAQGRIFLLGDAAHLMPPFGGQGMNSGLRDAHNLCWKLALVLKKRAHPSLLATYEQERRPHAAQMILFSSLLGQIIMPTSKLIAGLRNLLFRLLINPLPPLRNALTEMRVKPPPRYSRGFLLSSNTRRNRSLIGQLSPQPYVLTARGERMLLDDVSGNAFKLLRLCEKPDELEVLRIEDGRCIWEKVVDKEEKIGKFLGYRRDICVLLRPDGYVTGIFGRDEDERAIASIPSISTKEGYLRGQAGSEGYDSSRE